MACTKTTLTPIRQVIRGDSDIFTVQFNTVYINNLGAEVKTPIDISTWTIRLTVRASVPASTVTSDADALISSVATITDGPNGIATFNISPEDTNIDEGSYWYDIQIVGNGATRSLPKAKYIILGDITRTIG